MPPKYDMPERVIQPLDYARPGLPRGDGWNFGRLWLIFAVLGIAANVGLVWNVVTGLHEASWAYHDLLQNSRAFGREIDPARIAMLRRPVGLWVSAGVLAATATFGLLLAINLLCAVIQRWRNTISTFDRLRVYARWKPIGAVGTTLALLWFGNENFTFWVTATNHWPIGSGDLIQYLPFVIFFGCAWLPAWWARKHVDRAVE